MSPWPRWSAQPTSVLPVGGKIIYYLGLRSVSAPSTFCKSVRTSMRRGLMYLACKESTMTQLPRFQASIHACSVYSSPKTSETIRGRVEVESERCDFLSPHPIKMARTEHTRHKPLGLSRHRLEDAHDDLIKSTTPSNTPSLYCAGKGQVCLRDNDDPLNRNACPVLASVRRAIRQIRTGKTTLKSTSTFLR